MLHRTDVNLLYRKCDKTDLFFILNQGKRLEKTIGNEKREREIGREGEKGGRKQYHKVAL